MSTISTNRVRRETVGAFLIAIPVVAALLVLTGLVLGWKLALVGTFVGACMVGFIGMPMWLATLTEHNAHE